LGGDLDREFHHGTPCSANDRRIAAANFFQIWRPTDGDRYLLFHPRRHSATNLGQRLVGIFIGLAFVLWGLEQFLSDQVVISFIDDVVVFLFVVDLSIVIRHNLRNCAGERQVQKASFPVVKTIENFNFAAQPSIDERHFRTSLQGRIGNRDERRLSVRSFVRCEVRTEVARIINQAH
jgi:hypothetical protein